MITPHFNDSGATTDPDGLCNDLANALSAFFTGAREINVKAYDAQGTVPVFPQGDATVNAGLAPASTAPRELAVCLSFFSERNLPRQRGRLYIPYQLLGGGAPSTARPTLAIRDSVALLVPIFTDLGGADVDWCVYSRRDDTARPVTNWFVDDEWDVIRSRGLRPSDRSAGTTSEA